MLNVKLLKKPKKLETKLTRVIQYKYKNNSFKFCEKSWPGFVNMYRSSQIYTTDLKPLFSQVKDLLLPVFCPISCDFVNVSNAQSQWKIPSFITKICIIRVKPCDSIFTENQCPFVSESLRCSNLIKTNGSALYLQASHR